MGLSSSLLDENKLSFIKSWVQTELKNFASVYKKQYSLAFLANVHDQLVQHKQEHTRLLQQRDPPQEAEVIYQETILYFCLNRKWKKRFVVVRANYSVECHESYETFIKGIPPLITLTTTGGTVLTTEEKYMEIVDRCFPQTCNVKEDFAPVFGMPGHFPVYLRLPYHRDYYFCFLQETDQAMFCSVLSDCIRHQNHDFLKNKSYEVQAFIKAVELYRQEMGYYEAWEMLIGNDAQVLANLTMEELMPVLEKDLLARLKAKKMEKKRLWFATVEAVYNLVLETLTEGMAALNAECRDASMHQSARMLSDMDQIISSRAFLENKLRVTVAELATEYCKQHIKPRLPAMLEEMMGPISMGFAEAGQVTENMMEQLCQKFQTGLTREELQQAWVEMSKPNLQSCYEKVSGLNDHIREFSYPNCRGLEQSTQIDIQQLVDSASYTFGLLLNKSSQDNTDLLDAMIKAKQRVLKQYDYDSSTLRKKIFQDALLSIVLPSLRAFLAPTFKKELPDFQQYIFSDYVNFINVENIYEDILQGILNLDISKEVKEAASMKKYDLHIESGYRFSVSSRYSTPDSPDYTSSITALDCTQPSSLLRPSLPERQGTSKGPGIAEKKVEEEVFIDQQVANPELAQAEHIKVCLNKGIVKKVIMVPQANPQPELISGPEKKVSAEKKGEQEVIVQVHGKPDLKIPAGKDTFKKKIEPELIVQTQPEQIKMTPGKYPIKAGKKVEQEVKVQVHAQPELITGCSGRKTIVPEKVVKERGQKVEDKGVQSVPVAVNTAILEMSFVAIPSLKVKTNSESANVATNYTKTLVDMSSLNTKPAAHIKTEPEPLDTAVQGSPIDSPSTPVQASTPVQGSPIASFTPLVCGNFIASSTPPVQASTPVPGSPIASLNFLVQVRPPASPSVKASQLVSASLPVKDSPPAHSYPPDGTTYYISQNLKSDNEAESTAKIRSCSAIESTPNIQPQIQTMVQTINTTGDNSVAVDNLASFQPKIYKIKVSNGTQYFSDDSSWTTEEDRDSIEDDDPTTEIPAAVPIPSDCIISKGETESNTGVAESATDAKAEAARPLDCIREIRELVVEVIDVEEVPQHYPDDGEHHVHS